MLSLSFSVLLAFVETKSMHLFGQQRGKSGGRPALSALPDMIIQNETFIHDEDDAVSSLIFAYRFLTSFFLYPDVFGYSLSVGALIYGPVPTHHVDYHCVFFSYLNRWAAGSHAKRKSSIIFYISFDDRMDCLECLPHSPLPGYVKSCICMLIRHPLT